MTNSFIVVVECRRCEFSESSSAVGKASLTAGAWSVIKNRKIHENSSFHHSEAFIESSTLKAGVVAKQVEVRAENNHEWNAQRSSVLFFRTFSGENSRWWKTFLFPKFLFLNKCFTYQNYCRCVLKTPAVVWASTMRRKIVFPPAAFEKWKVFSSLAREKWFSLDMRNTQWCLQMIFIFFRPSLRWQFSSTLVPFRINFPVSCTTMRIYIYTDFALPRAKAVVMLFMRFQRVEKGFPGLIDAVLLCMTSDNRPSVNLFHFNAKKYSSRASFRFIKLCSPFFLAWSSPFL